MIKNLIGDKIVRVSCIAFVIGIVLYVGFGINNDYFSDVGEKYDKGDSLYTDEEMEKLILGYETELKQNPNDLIVLKNIVWSLNDLSRFTEALEYINRAIEILPDDEKSFLELLR